MMNGAYALAYLKMEQPGVAEHLKPNYMVDATRRLYAGHSMGGHGCLVYATLQPDYGVAAACASGWIRRELYVSSLQYAAGMSRIDRMRAGYLQTSLDEYSVDLHLRNMAGMPVLLRMGSADDTVP